MEVDHLLTELYKYKNNPKHYKGIIEQFFPENQVTAPPKVSS